MDHYLRSDERLDTMTSLEMVCEQLPKVVDEPHRWKWVVIALHNALQGSMVLALKGSAGLDVMTDKNAKKLLAFLTQDGASSPKLWLDDFGSLFRKIQRPECMARLVGSRHFEPKGTQTDSVKILNEIRNTFIHFFPKTQSTAVHDLLAILQDCIDIIDFLLFKSENVSWFEPSYEPRAAEATRGIRLHLEVVSQRYDESSGEVSGRETPHDFSRGERGKFYHPDVELHLPVYLDPDVAAFIGELADRKGTEIGRIVNDWLRKSIDLVQSAQ
ncbi:MAG: hypothetical protein AB1646_19305 [Thermodesulfobacteriota bacterium]